tara:strand:- start:850 stop:1590 length:741 start_codon:yes stop_codon:yes gene_type:complete
MINNTLIESMIQNNPIALIIEKNFYKQGKYEALFAYEKRPSIKDFRTSEETRNKYFLNLGVILKDDYPFKISDRYSKILDIKKSPVVSGIINLNIDGILKLEDPSNIIDLEGNISWLYCSTCGMDKSMESVINNQDEIVCIGCNNNILKPSIPFQGQDIAEWDYRDSWMLLNGCESLVVLSTEIISPITYSFIEIATKRNKEIYIAKETGNKYEDLDADMTNVNFLDYSVDAFLDIMIESLGNKIL